MIFQPATFAVTMLVTLAMAPEALAVPETARRAAFEELHGLTVDVDDLVARLDADMQAALEIEDGTESRDALRGAAVQTLADYPDMPGAYRAILSAALPGCDALENPWRGRAQLLMAYHPLIERPDAFAIGGPEAFPRVLHLGMRRGHAPGLNHGEKLAVLSSALLDLAGQADLLPSPLYGTSLRALVEGTTSDVAVAAAGHLVLGRGAARLYPGQDEPPHSGRQAFLRAALGSLDEYTPAALGRAVLMRFADLGAASPHLGEGDRAQLRAAGLVAGATPDDAQAVEILKAALQGLTIIPGQTD